MIIERFFPKEYVNSIYEIDYIKLIKNNITGLIFDIDNTIVPFDISEPDTKIVDFFRSLTTLGFKICLLSNNGQDRVLLFNKHLKLHAIHKAGKPKLKGINNALNFLQTSVEETVIIGDQVFTDIWVGNRKGIYSILVKPIAERDEFTVKLKRGLEKIVVNEYKRRSKING